MGFWSRLLGREPRRATASSGPPPVVARDEALEAAIARDPDAIEPYLVYADWLQAEGDPRGELIALQAEAARHGANDAVSAARQHWPRTIAPPRPLPDGAHARAADALIARHPDHFLAGHEVEWRCGFWHTLRYRLFEGKRGGLAEAAHRARLADTLAHPSARFLRALHLWIDDGASPAALLPDRLPPTLRTLYLGDFDFPEECELSWCDLGDVSALAPRLGALEALVLQGNAMLRDPVELPSLRTLEWITVGVADADLVALARSRLPRLETLSVWVGDPDPIGELLVTIDALAELARAELPSLTALGLRNCALTDELVPLLLESPLLPRLRRLDLSLGALTDAGAARLAAAGDRLAHLELLDVTESLLTKDGLAVLARLPCPVAAGDQVPERRGDDGARYVAITE